MDPFARSAEPLARCREDRDALSAAKQGFDKRGRQVDQVLAIVE